jgi:hypothetical protein
MNGGKQVGLDGNFGWTIRIVFLRVITKMNLGGFATILGEANNEFDFKDLSASSSS